MRTSTVHPAIVINMFYTGLGIARSLGEHGIPVIGLTAHRGAYGNFTRYAEIRRAPDSRQAPEELCAFLLRLAGELPSGAVVFPTRDDDVLFLERFRTVLERHFTLVLPGSRPLEVCLNKWETHVAAQAAGTASPRTWHIESMAQLRSVLPEVVFPCVLKPVFAQHWRKAKNWQMVGQRKAVGVSSAEELIEEYGRIERAESRALLQEMITGGDDCLWIAACYLDRNSRLVAGFTAQKLIQVPAGFGTGCMVQTVNRPDLLQKAATLLKRIGFSGIAEVEFKWDASSNAYKLIEINPRPWDQHRLGKACGVDLVHIAYCDLGGMPKPAIAPQRTGQKWIAEDVFSLLLLRAFVKRTGDLKTLLQMARGERVYPISSLRDPIPMLAFVGLQLVPELVRTVGQLLRKWIRATADVKKGVDYGLERAKN
jgi:predicted ATP-grasp superfamily ATP-dependent carboligase